MGDWCVNARKAHWGPMLEGTRGPVTDFERRIKELLALELLSQKLSDAGPIRRQANGAPAGPNAAPANEIVGAFALRAYVAQQMAVTANETGGASAWRMLGDAQLARAAARASLPRRPSDEPPAR